jgi:hypothetical protein
MTNQALLKADWALADLSSGGLLVDEQANRFVRKLIKEPTLLRDIRTVEMNSPQRQINKLQFGSRILRAGTQGTALTQAQRSAPTTEQVLLTTFEVIAEVRLPYDVMEDNIERIGTLGADGDGGSGTALSGGIRDTVVDLIAERAALDLEELALNGDTSSADTYLAQTDGYLVEVETNGNIADHGGAKIAKELFKVGMQTLPDQYLRNTASMRHYVSVDNDIEYRDTLANRATGAGDSFVQGQQNPTPYGVPVSRVQTMPEDKGLFTQPLNLMMGIQRQVMMEFDKDITTRVYIIVLTARIAVQVEESEASVAYNNIGAAL